MQEAAESAAVVDPPGGRGVADLRAVDVTYEVFDCAETTAVGQPCYDPEFFRLWRCECMIRAAENNDMHTQITYTKIR